MTSYKNLNVWIFSMKTVKEIYNITKILSEGRKVWIDISDQSEPLFQYQAILLKD